MSLLKLDPNIVRPDDTYELLIGLYEGLDMAEANLASAAMILILSNHIGDQAVLHDAVMEARRAAENGRRLKLAED